MRSALPNRSRRCSSRTRAAALSWPTRSAAPAPGSAHSLIVPAAGVTHAASGIGEAFLDGIPMLVIAGGIRRDLGRAYQLHDMDQHALLAPITKARWRIERHADVMPVIHEAYRVATSGEPGPVFVEIPVDLQLMPGDAGDRPEFTPAPAAGHSAAPTDIARAAELLRAAKHPGIFCGWGAVDATAELIAIAELLGAPVSTTLQGLSVLSRQPPVACRLRARAGRRSRGPRMPLRDCDCLLAVGTRFAEIPTGSYGYEPPANLIHVDINPRVFGANYPPAVALEGDARAVLVALRDALGMTPESRARTRSRQPSSKDKNAYREAWLGARLEGARESAALLRCAAREAAG